MSYDDNNTLIATNKYLTDTLKLFNTTMSGLDEKTFRDLGSGFVIGFYRKTRGQTRGLTV